MKNASSLFCVAVLLALACPCAAAEPPSDPRIHAVENGLVPFQAGPSPDGASPAKAEPLASRMAEYKIPGVSVAVFEDGRIAWAKGYGTCRAGQDIPVTTDTMFEAASTTKVLTAATALHLVETGRLELDKDVNAYLKSWKIPDTELTREHKVTLRLLLTHRSGLNGPKGGFSWEDGKVPTLVQVLKGEAPALNKPAAIEIVPGTEWRYSNFGYVVVQLLLEDVTGKPFPELVADVIFKPCHMDSSTLVYPLAGGFAKREALPHDAEGKTREAVLHPTAVAQGGLLTTPSDLARFAIALADSYQGKPGALLSQRMALAMFQKELDLDPEILGFPMGEGLGVLLRGSGKDLSFLHPGDNAPGASCWLVGYPASGKGAVVMTNGAKGNLLAMELLAAIAQQYHWPAP
jgi:CubicO group peptidase (beta-lactamase class C family)